MNHNLKVPPTLPQRQRTASAKVKEALKGKSRDEKKKLLHELEMRKQREIELVYERERQQMLQDEKWAVRNVAEKIAAEQRIMGLE